jgi:hypothetical protein
MNPDRLKSWATVGGMIAFTVVAAAGLRYAISPNRPATIGTNPNPLPPGIAARVNRMEYTAYEYDGETRKTWVVHADVLDISSDKSRVEARGNVEAELLDAPTGKRRALITAPTAVFTRNSKTLQVAGKIVCQAPGTNIQNDLRVEAETLIWNIGAKQIMCPGEVVAVLPNRTGTARGRELTLDLTTREWSLQKFHGEFALREGQGNTPPPFVNPLKGLPF